MEDRSFEITSSPGTRFVALKTDCGVTHAYNPYAENIKHPDVIQYEALWDTGATNTVISKKVVVELKLIPQGKAQTFHANGHSIVDVYYINLHLPNSMGVPFLRVTQGVLTGMDILIGMDIIGSGDFSITRNGNSSTFKFSLTPTEGAEELSLTTKKSPSVAPAGITHKISRNDPCFCGSGKKFKNCHGVGSYANSTEPEHADDKPSFGKILGAVARSGKPKKDK